LTQESASSGGNLVGKRHKQPLKPAAGAGSASSSMMPRELAPVGRGAVHPPAKHPTLLAVSIALFALWFLFLLVTALLG
jgi:hypothetical protein